MSGKNKRPSEAAVREMTSENLTVSPELVANARYEQTSVVSDSYPLD